MLDIKQIRENFESIVEKLYSRNIRGKYLRILQDILKLDQQQREIEGTRTLLSARSNEIGKLVGQKSRQEGNSEEIEALKIEGQTLKNQISELDPQEKEVKTQLRNLLLQLPNLPSDSSPIGEDERDNREIRRWGDEYLPTNVDLLPHWEIGEKLGILDTKKAVKVAQSRFASLIGAGAALERALINFML
ncbi:MAG: serine--tRNA ligase, partial [Snowella sp.]